MATEEQILLANKIKGVHLRLRERTKEIGAELAWTQHLSDNKCLENYAKSMETLASNYWECNSKDVRKQAESRIDWVCNYCKEYFLSVDGSLVKLNREKEIKIQSQINSESPLPELLSFSPQNNKIKLLDVGSCYNPFNSFNYIESTAIDIAPANETVHRCDFLKMPLSNENEISFVESKLVALPNKYFDVVVFSLVLEYLPTSNQRMDLCRNAYEVLKFEGILIIITPDSKHIGANARLMKNWRYTLSLMGFSRINITKLAHITCMVFRKALFKEVPQRWAEIHKEEYMENVINIPQDFNHFESSGSESCEVVKVEKPEDLNLMKVNFSELPDLDFDNKIS